MNRARWWEWSWGASQTAAGTLLAAGIVYITTVIAGVLTFHLALILAGAALGVAIIGFAFYAASKLPPIPGTPAEQLEELDRLRDEGRLTSKEFRKRK
jgi:hypothetical protein